MSIKKLIEKKLEKCDSGCCKQNNTGGNSSAVYGIGLFGAAYYFFPQAVGVGGFFLAILKTLGWPALLVYHAMGILGLK